MKKLHSYMLILSLVVIQSSFLQGMLVRATKQYRRPIKMQTSRPVSTDYYTPDYNISGNLTKTVEVAPTKPSRWAILRFFGVQEPNPEWYKLRSEKQREAELNFQRLELENKLILIQTIKKAAVLEKIEDDARISLKEVESPRNIKHFEFIRHLVREQIEEARKARSQLDLFYISPYSYNDISWSNEEDIKNAQSNEMKYIKEYEQKIVQLEAETRKALADLKLVKASE